ncbi:hypothetical protein CPB84DRAFT_1783449 [Gymnopilus junonius]|uniref:Carbohydrate-binding module family 13 protein n=1 Tax=Gymnopilus junonius TaxID=109634 RepID=A0A9P5NLF1_GYMJU|nr:hypothetical protein CPB84DRAFT_1783449 [Gymnopilus junonius]
MPHLATVITISTLVLARLSNAQVYSATYLPSNAPPTTEQGQTGTNQCGTGSSQSSNCQNAYLNSLTDWCVFAPPNPGPDSVIGNTERIEVSWCLQSGTGTRLIPDGAITGAHFIITPDFVQVTGVGDLTKINIPAGDAGLDPHGADGNGNPIGGLVFSNAFGQLQQMHEWTNFVSDSEFCFRACRPSPQAPRFCEHIYDVLGCAWNMPGNYGTGFTSCHADSGEPMGVYGTSTFFQGQPSTPAAHPAPASSSCVTLNTIGNGVVITTPNGGPASTSSSSSPSASATKSSTTTSSSGSSSDSSSTVSLSSSSGSGQASTGSSTSTRSSTNTSPTSTSSASSSGTTPTGTGSSATRSASLDGWERAVLSFGSAVIFSMLGAVFVL